jgi:SAM-dependent methyltransferase
MVVLVQLRRTPIEHGLHSNAVLACAWTSGDYVLKRWGASYGRSDLRRTLCKATQLFIPALLGAARVASGQTILDAPLELALPHERRLTWSVQIIAGDISPTMLEAARRNLMGLPITLEMLAGQALPYPDNGFDAVICQLGLMFFTDPARGLSEFYRVLRNGGWAAVSVTTTP